MGGDEETNTGQVFKLLGSKSHKMYSKLTTTSDATRRISARVSELTRKFR